MFAFERRRRRRRRRRRHRHFGFEACLAARFLAVFHFQGKKMMTVLAGDATLRSFWEGVTKKVK